MASRRRQRVQRAQPAPLVSQRPCRRAARRPLPCHLLAGVNQACELRTAALAVFETFWL